MYKIALFLVLYTSAIIGKTFHTFRRTSRQISYLKYKVYPITGAWNYFGQHTENMMRHPVWALKTLTQLSVTFAWKVNKFFLKRQNLYIFTWMYFFMDLILIRRSRIFRLIFKKCRNFMDLNTDNTAHINHKWHDSQSP